MSSPLAIDLAGVHVRFGAVPALTEVNLQVQQGSLCALCGPNGAGKSTAIRLVCGLLRPSAGSGEVLGESIHTRRVQRRARIGYMAQHTVLYDELTVAENIGFRAAIMGLKRHSEHARDALRDHGLESVSASRVGLLSGGWRQRVAFCAAQLAHPPLLVLDEPTIGLDAGARAQLWAQLRALCAEGVAVLVSTHDPAEASLCDQLVVLERGQLAFSGAPSQRWSEAEVRALQTAAAIGMRAA